jgi:hypothetical protein
MAVAAKIGAAATNAVRLYGFRSLFSYGHRRMQQFGKPVLARNFDERISG